MADVKIPDLTDGTAINVADSDLLHIWNVGLARSEKKNLPQIKSILRGLGYVITASGGWEAGTFASSTTYFFGGDLFNSSHTGLTQYGNAQIEIQRAGTIRFLYIKVVISTPGSSEAVSHSIRINDTTDVAAFNLSFDVNFTDGFNNAAAALSAGDQIAFKVVTPAWVSAPVGIRWYFMVYID